MDRNETLADLAEAVRKMARYMEENADWENDVIVVDHTLVEGFNYLADRIEAAAKRETVPGNAAKLREALKKCLELGERIDSCLAGSEETVWAFRAERSMAHNIAEFARAALAAPARNCDCFVTSVDAIAYFNKHNQPLRADPRPNLIDGKKYERFSDWLMDTANGAAKGGE